MKYLVVLAVLAVAYTLWRSQRAAARPPQRPGAGAPQDMVACAHCGVHLPRGEALMQRGRSYCCQAHRDLAD